MDCVWLSPQCGYYKLERRKVQQKTVFQLESSLSVLNRKSRSGADSQDSHLEHTSGEKLTSGYMPLESFLKYCKWSIKAESRWFFQEVSEPRRRVRKRDTCLMRVFFPNHKSCQNRLSFGCYTRFLHVQYLHACCFAESRSSVRSFLRQALTWE